jgi:hypothetical protein
VGVFDRLFGKAGAGEARKAEARGDLARAVELWTTADRPDEAARVMILRGDSEPDARARLQHYTQAAATAPQGHAIRKTAIAKRCELVIALAGQTALSAVARRDVQAAARDLEAIGEPVRAAEAYRLVGDTEGEARALAAAGEVDKLEDLLAEQHAKEREKRREVDLGADVELHMASGRRREALLLAEQLASRRPDDQAARERAQAIRARKALGPIASVVLSRKPLAIVLGDEVVVGRTEGTLLAPSHAVSRRHLRIARSDGAVVVTDLETRNGTQLRGMNVVGPLPVGDGLELKLGREVGVRIRPSTDLDGAVEIELGGKRYVAPLGPANLPIPGWRLDRGPDDWLELCCDGTAAYFGDVALVERASLLVGDRIARVRGGEPVLEILGG